MTSSILNSSIIHFKCLPLPLSSSQPLKDNNSSNILPSLNIETKKCLHLKGFAHRLNAELCLNTEMFNIIHQYDMIQWDGDILRSQSFTKFIIAILCSYENINDSPLLLGYRFDFKDITNNLISQESKQFINNAMNECSLEPFLNSWDDIIVKYNEYLDENIKKSNISIIEKNNINENENDILKEKIIYYKVIKPDNNRINNEFNPYLELGYHALLDTKSKTIFCIGGGPGIKTEYYSYLEGMCCIKDLKWFVWLVDRTHVATNSANEDDNDIKFAEMTWFHELQSSDSVNNSVTFFM